MKKLGRKVIADGVVSSESKEGLVGHARVFRGKDVREKKINDQQSKELSRRSHRERLERGKD